MPSLSLDDEAIELFVDRARRVRSGFTVTDENNDAVKEICRRLDGMPLAIELAAARVRALTLHEIVDSLHDRFRLLTGGSRTAVRRQQTLHASVDWSHALLTEPERILFRRLAVFMGGFDLDAARAVAGGAEVERYQVLDQLTLLVGKSLVVADDTGAECATGCWKRCASTPWKSSASPVKPMPYGRVTVITTPRWPRQLDAPAGSDYEQRLEQAETEIDNLRAAFGWSRENSDVELALALASSLQPLWLARGRIREGLAWFDAVLADVTRSTPRCGRGAGAGARRRGGARHLVGRRDSLDQAEQALAIAREVGDPALLARALTACGLSPALQRRGGPGYFAEANELARASAINGG